LAGECKPATGKDKLAAVKALMTGIDDLKERAAVDGAAALALAEAVLMGDDGPPDARAAYALVEQSARLGHADGQRAWVYATASGIGCPPDPAKARAMLAELAKEDRFAAVQQQFLAHLTCEQRAATAEPKTLVEDPDIRLYPQLFSAAECRYLSLLGTPWLERALVIDEATGQGIADEVRDADTSSFPPLAEDLVVQAINRALATVTGTDAGWGEPLTILRYRPGQQYRPHHDAGGLEKGTGMRHWTALIWLNDTFGGGETHFPDLNISVRGGVGDLLVFRNVVDGRPDPRMLHAGLPVTSGEKWMASRWIRGEDYLTR
jgi:prolyl 4-hydroxylase